MKTLRKILIITIVFPISIIIGLSISILTSFMWPIYIICLLFDNLIRSFTKTERPEHNYLNSMVEFIFLCYGFAGLFLSSSMILFESIE